MTMEQRLSNLENLVNALSKKIDDNKFYQQADIDGTRQSVNNITPYTETKTAYYGEEEKTFYGVPSGNLNVFFSNYKGKYEYMKIADRLVIYFDALKEQTEITISIL
jgi:hypothetical protein